MELYHLLKRNWQVIITFQQLFNLFTQFVEGEEGSICQKYIPAEVEMSHKSPKKHFLKI
jgi:hypothetical protein